MHRFLRLAMLPWLLMGLLWMAVGAHAKSAVPESDDPVLEARVLAIAEELRCLVCQNETIAASRADLAIDLRKQIRLKQIGPVTPEVLRDDILPMVRKLGA